LKMAKVRGDQAPAKPHKMFKIFENSYENRRVTTHELADIVGTSYGVCQDILTENLNKCLIAAKIVSRLLTNNPSL
jgi:hypothetical protein